MLLFKRNKGQPQKLNIHDKANESLLKIKECKEKLASMEEIPWCDITRKYFGYYPMSRDVFKNLIKNLRENMSDNETLEEVFIKLVKDADEYFYKEKMKDELREIIEKEKKKLEEYLLKA